MTTSSTKPKAPASKWHWDAATVVSVHDGDTFRLDCPTAVKVRTGRVALPFGAGFMGSASGTVHQPQDVRLFGGNAAELATDQGKRAQARVAELMPVGSTVAVTTYSVDKWGGRYDAAVTLADGRDLADVLHAEGLFAWWDGEGAKPVPSGRAASS